MQARLYESFYLGRALVCCVLGQAKTCGGKMKPVKLSRNFLKMAEVYRYFAREYQATMDFSQEMLTQLYVYESTGEGLLSENNGFVFGKRNIDIAVSSWIEDIEAGYLWVHELYEDENLPAWFLDKVLVKYSHRPKSQADFDRLLADWRKELMPSYFDKFGRLHHKPCKDGEPSSNNSWLYSAFYKKAGGSLSFILLNECFRDCVKQHPDGQLFLIRSPDKPLPPFSRDEAIGLAYLGLLHKEHLNGWNFSPYPVPRFSLKTLLKQLWELRPILKKVKSDEFKYVQNYVEEYAFEYMLVWKHRNYFWQNNLDQLYRFAFSVPLVDRHFLLTHTNISCNIVSRAFYKLVAKLDSLKKPKNGIHWLKYGKGKEEMLKEFPADHPLRSL